MVPFVSTGPPVPVKVRVPENTGSRPVDVNVEGVTVLVGRKPVLQVPSSVTPLAGATPPVRPGPLEEGERLEPQDTEVPDGRSRVGDDGVDVDADTEAGPQGGVTVESPRHVTYNSGPGPHPEGVTEVRPAPVPVKVLVSLGPWKYTLLGKIGGSRRGLGDRCGIFLDLMHSPTPDLSGRGVGYRRNREEGQAPRTDSELPVRPPPTDTVATGIPTPVSVPVFVLVLGGSSSPKLGKPDLPYPSFVFVKVLTFLGLRFDRTQLSLHLKSLLLLFRPLKVSLLLLKFPLLLKTLRPSVSLPAAPTPSLFLLPFYFLLSVLRHDSSAFLSQPEKTHVKDI